MTPHELNEIAILVLLAVVIYITMVISYHD